MSDRHIMIDIETWSTEPDACITEIGAVSFGPHTYPEHDFRVGVNPKDANQGRISADTVLWWSTAPNREAFRAWCLRPMRPLWAALRELAGYFEWDGAKVWANSPSFDLVILRSAYKRVGLECPWGYRQERDYRTLLSLGPLVEIPSFKGTAHDALDDARHQAQVATRILEALER